MIYPSGDELEKQVGSKFALVMAVSKRAKQLREGFPPQVETRSTNCITIALEEIAAGKLKITIPTQAQMDEAERQEGVPKATAAREAAELLRAAAGEELVAEGIVEIAEPAPEIVQETPMEQPVEEPAVEAVEEAPVAEAKPKRTRKKAEPVAVEEPEVVEEVIEAAPVEEAPAKKTRAKAKAKAAKPEETTETAE